MVTMALDDKYYYDALTGDGVRFKREPYYHRVYTKIILLAVCFLAGGAGYFSVKALTEPTRSSSVGLQRTCPNPITCA